MNKNYSTREAAISLPYELLPRPRKDDTVQALDRSGRVVCPTRVVRVLDSKALDRCAVITIAVPKKFYNRVRNIRVKSKKSKQE